MFLNVKLNLKTNLFYSYKNIYRELEQNIKTADAVEDLRWFRANQGPGMSMNWPQFEVRSQYLKPRFVIYLTRKGVNQKLCSGFGGFFEAKGITEVICKPWFS